MNLASAAIVLALAAVARAQDAPALEPITAAYRAGPTAERIVIEASRGDSPPARSEMTIAIRPGETPAVALALGDDDPLRILAEPGRVLAWRASEPARVYVAALGEPFGRQSIERVLPPLLAPQIDLALDPEPGPLLAFMPELSWSLVARGERDRYVGVAIGAALSLAVDRDGRLHAYEVQREGRVLVRATVTALEPDPAWFQAPDLDRLDGPPVASLADLARPGVPVRVGDVFGQALGIDARGRPATLRDLAKGGAERGGQSEAERGGDFVVLAVDARQREARAQLVAALAEADLAQLTELLDVRIIILAIGSGDTAALFERVIEQPRATLGRPPIRVLATPSVPPWLGLAQHGAAYAVRGRSWVLRAVHEVGQEVPPANIDTPPIDAPPIDTPDPWQSEAAPRTLAERLLGAVGAAGRELE